MTVDGVYYGSELQGTFGSGTLGALSIVLGSLSVSAAQKEQEVAKNKLNIREVELAKRDTLSNKLIVLWGGATVMEWISAIPGSVFAAGRLFFAILGRSLSSAMSAFRFYNHLQDLKFFNRLSDSDEEGVKRYAQTKLVATKFSIASEACFLGYFILQLTSLLVGYAIATGLSTFLIAAAIALLMAGIVCNCIAGTAPVTPIKV